MEATVYITRQDIVNFPFPYKLWLVVHLEFCDFLRWNRDGTVLLLDLVSLEDYLNSTRSIFKIKNRSMFLKHLDEFKFERLNATPEDEEDLLLQYKNENFQRHRLDLLAKLRRYTYQSIGENPTVKCEKACGGSGTNAEEMVAVNNRVSERMLGDLCFMFHGGLSKIQVSRLHFQTILNFQNETRALEQKLQACNEHASEHRRGKSDISTRSTGGGFSTAEEDQIIELPVDLYENPHDSVLLLDKDFCPEYAGYYGNCSKEKVINFFGDYLPMYEGGSIEAKKIIVDNSTALNSNQDVKIQQYNPNIMESHGIFSSTPIAQSSLQNLNFSSGLEPIFKTEDNQDNINLGPEDMNATQLNTNNLNNVEVEISMEEFIKFKDTSNKLFANARESQEEYQEINNNKNEQTVATKDFPQMPTAVKMEIVDDTVENETNFRNFFSQYRASLNLLYERH